mmetsp:Transcript_7291/g.22457  ORF Transcript_7291/g.22457 Transcript_7291/m.22457 type:complete len:113 (+) Transcript_7291:468-806(+)|eukprot:CAMPEP_0198644560 /NCGR_PEP_ID=MMETSP1467-20131203/702_1 /TAXON_ID=1462469 /ORGANISM="unid. sp., Strain CCMP2135" /LENGTH=112 /DNA_ID=CAMNT_0044380017 /DNA_START=640 /DNA_END=981 /DNA_ORIENTATION=-
MPAKKADASGNEAMAGDEDDEVKTIDAGDGASEDDLRKMAILKHVLGNTMAPEELLDKYLSNMRDAIVKGGKGDGKKNKVAHESPADKKKKKPKKTKEQSKKEQDEFIALDG